MKSKAAYDAGESERLKKQLEEEERKRKEAENLRAKAEKAKAEAEAERSRALAAEKAAVQAQTMAEEERHIAVEARATAERNERRANLLSVASGIALAIAVVLGIWAYINLIGVRRERAEKNLILCKEYVVDAQLLLEANYCTSALEKMGRAAQLIDDYGNLGDDETCQAYERERKNVDDLRQVVDNKQKEGSCQVD